MSNTRRIILLLFGYIIHVSLVIPIDNGVEGDPEVECGANDIVINFNTQNPFEGHVYVKGSFNDKTCRSSDTGRRVAGITIPFDRCNVMRSRSLNPQGIFVTTTVIISFHPSFITKIDRAYTVRCFYMEAHKTLSLGITVSDITTIFHTHAVPMPVCKYEIVAGGPDGEPVSFAMVGQQVYHKWTCVSETEQVFCMVVHSCNVDDGNNDVVLILDENGCALDKYILNNLEYPDDLVASQEAHVYKYADRSQLFYQCQITITTKDRNKTCPRPQCPEPIGRGAGSGSGPVNSQGGTSANNSLETGAASSKNRTEFDDVIANFSLPASAGLNITGNSSLAARFREFLQRSKKDIVDWRDHSVGTVDVRTEMSALDAVQKDTVGGTSADEMDAVLKPTIFHNTCNYSTLFLASVFASCSGLLVIGVLLVVHKFYIIWFKRNLKTVPD